MIEKFNLYDLVANLIPGALFFWSLGFLAWLVGCPVPLPFKHLGEFKEASLLIVLSYVAGLMWQSLSVLLVEKLLVLGWGGSFPSALWLMADNTRFSPTFKDRIKARAVEQFKISLEPEKPDPAKGQTERGMQLRKNQEIFFLCFAYVNNLSPRPQVFNSQYCQFRCLTAVFGVFALAAVFIALVRQCCAVCSGCGSLWLFGLVYGLAMWLAYRSCREYGENFAKSIYDLFASGVTAKPEKE